jgi:hypothetical protein
MSDEHIIQALPNSPKAIDAATLPPEVGRRLQILRDGVRDASAFTSGLAYRAIQLNDTRRDASARLASFKKLRGVDDSHPEVIALTATIAEVDEERGRLDERLTSHNATTAPRAQLLRNVEDWLRVNSTRYDFAQATVQAKAQKGETPAAAVDRLRRRIRELTAEQNRVESAIYPLATAVQVAKDFISARARPPVASSCLEHAGPLLDDGGRLIEQAIVFPKMQLHAGVATAQGPGVAIKDVEDHIGFLCWLMPDLIVATITEELLRPESDDANALDHNQRRTKLATIAQDRLLLEAEEVELMFAALTAGVVIEPRGDCSPQAFLGVTLRDKAEAPPVNDTFGRARQAQATGIAS